MNEVKAKYRKYWSSEYQQYYYVNLMDEDETQLWDKPWIIDLCFRAYVRCDKLPFERLQEIPRNHISVSSMSRKIRA